jgi:hypothetical protein
VRRFTAKWKDEEGESRRRRGRVDSKNRRRLRKCRGEKTKGSKDNEADEKKKETRGSRRRE